MASIIISNAQTRWKDSIASSPTLGLAVRSNGEERVKVIDSFGNVYNASLDAPTVAPTLSLVTASGMTDGWYGYAYAYASSKFPFVEASAIGGKLYPRSNPSPSETIEITGNDHVEVEVTKTTNTLIDEIWVFRTERFATELEAQTAADAGQMFLIATIANDGIAGTETHEDDDDVGGTDPAEFDNFTAPQFQFCVYYEPYWWGFGNFPFNAEASWNNAHTGSTGLIELSNVLDTWYDGRDGQTVRLSGITTGGIDGRGTFRFKWLTSTTATVYTTDSATPVALPSTGSGTIIVQGPATTLFRSKLKNPFAWGWTQVIGDAIIPQQYAFKVGGGMGTALAVVPNEPILKMDTELPSKCFTLNLRAAGTSQFEPTLRCISDVYSITSHFSQFAARTSQGVAVLWGIDFKNFVVLESNGMYQKPVDCPLTLTLRSLSGNKSLQFLAHGVYDARTELNCLWVPAYNNLSLVNLGLFQHAPSNSWSFSNEHDVLASATIEDPYDSTRKTIVGTESGFVGQAFAPNWYNNWLPDTGLYYGTIASATVTTITKSDVEDFNTTDDGIIGNWCLITDAEGKQEQIARIANVTDDTLTFDRIYSVDGEDNSEFSPTPAVGWKFYIGIIESRILKHFDLDQPSADKRYMELWLTQQNVNASVAGTLVRIYREYAFPLNPQQIAVERNEYISDILGDSDVWYQKSTLPSELTKSNAFEIINRGYAAWRLFNITFKLSSPDVRNSPNA